MEMKPRRNEGYEVSGAAYTLATTVPRCLPFVYCLMSAAVWLGLLTCPIAAQVKLAPLAIYEQCASLSAAPNEKLKSDLALLKGPDAAARAEGHALFMEELRAGTSESLGLQRDHHVADVAVGGADGLGPNIAHGLLRHIARGGKILIQIRR